MIEPNTRNRVERAMIRAKLLEPVFLYLFPAALVLAFLVIAAGAAWWAAGLVALVVGAAGAAVRASVYCEAGHFRSLHSAVERWQSLTGSRR